jgi:hypothetical protein
MSFLWRLFGKLPKYVEHDVFGKCLFMRAKAGGYWECETVLNGSPFTVIIETFQEAPPSAEQSQFYREIVGDPDAAFERGASLLVQEYIEWTGQPFPASWTTAFKFVGMTVPLEGSATNDWDLSYDCLSDDARHMFTCYFVGGRPSYVVVDG